MKKITTLLLCAALALGARSFSETASVLTPARAEDVTPAALTENSPKIKTLVSMGILLGNGDGLELDAPLTRAEAAVLTDRLFSRIKSYSSGLVADYYDDTAGHWAADSINRLRNARELRGIADGDSFFPDAAITGSELALLLLNCLNYYSGPETVYNDGVACGLLTEAAAKSAVQNSAPLTRGEGCRLIYAALTANINGGVPLYRRLINEGYFVEELKRVSETANKSAAYFADALNAVLPQDKNYMFSPLSVRLALAMAANGAEGATKSEMLAALGITDLDAFNERVGELMSSYGEEDEMRLGIANSVWLNESETANKFAAPFISVIKGSYMGEARAVSRKNAVAEINSWVNDKTNGKIPSIISAPNFSATLINAVYFKAAWVNEFSEAATDRAIFTEADGTRRETDFMHNSEHCRFASTPAADIVSLPYRGGSHDLSMYVLLPKQEKIDVAAEIEKADFTNAFVRLSLPKFRIEYSVTLNDSLSALGMNKVFTDFAELGPMFDGDEPMKLTDVLHKTYIDVDEKGTEAAAVTAVMVAGTALPPEPVDFVADRPFCFSVRDNENGEILFMGKYMYVE